ncbi:glutamate-cysteine ligase family protein [Plantactinospora sp. KBS50]|uniref:glutamate-cysteine ligase family protein n=1 Tax=Plantactinospora sp. KBS50 TaxID=2024580 RepID=UPI000BAACB32|nr:glutamate-cysteine ligase family protein [Plantactinospora sp. KBS50]ASW55146.1 ergothioneine biosynthesis glutamate--cysteine ligase EgtA [Plantactinospora sp. KBS50]
MTTTGDLQQRVVLTDLAAAEAHLNRICFKTGPPRLLGTELEWTVHDAVQPDRPIDRRRLRAALGAHAPPTLAPDGPHRPLSRAGTVTVEPGGQLEISSAPHPSLGALIEATTADVAQLTELLAGSGLTLGDSGIDPYRPPRPVLETPRYRAMRRSFDRDGPAGRTMMHSTAGLQVCLDAGEPGHLPARWAALHCLGPVLLALFATASRHAGRDTGLASARMAAWQRIDPARTRPVWRADGADADPVAAWTGYALAAPLLCVRRSGADWTVPPGVTLADWIGGALPRPPTLRDLDYHLSTLFPPVRPRGYLEVRYLDAQPPGEWIAPVGMLAALFADARTVDAVRAACAPAADRWAEATSRGLADATLARAARAVHDLAMPALAGTDLPPAVGEQIDRIVRRRLAAAERSTP